MLRPLLVCALLLATAAGARADAVAPLSDDFASAATLKDWNVMTGDVIDGSAPRWSVANGELIVHAAHSEWYDGDRAFYLSKDVTGDFAATIRVHVTGETGPDPTANWSLAGLLLRAPDRDALHESWINFSIGRVRGTSVFERKTTTTANSNLVLAAAPTGWVELRQVRIGNHFYLLRRTDGGTWVVHWYYVRRDLPQTLEVGVDAQSGAQDVRADLVAHVDYVHFAAVDVPPRLRARVQRDKAKLKTLRPYLTG
jgi:hypothetical protein